MKIQIEFTDTELGDIVEALKLGLIQSQAPGEIDRFTLLTKKILAVKSLLMSFQKSIKNITIK